MSYECKIVADSVAENGCRLTTFEVTYPLIIHAEIMTHRVFSRNVASNRAIPVKKMLEAVQNSPFIPEKFPKNQAGMQSSEWLEGEEAQWARTKWLDARDSAVNHVASLLDLNVHKQITNRLLAPFLWTTAVISATEWKNFFSLRCNPMAQPEMQKIAYMMLDSYNNSNPQALKNGLWHLPYVAGGADHDGKEFQEMYEYLDDSRGVTTANIVDKLAKVSIARCARVSYLTQNNERPFEEDLNLYTRLSTARHLSPLEHVAQPLSTAEFCGNFRGWKQWRKFVAGESGE